MSGRRQQLLEPAARSAFGGACAGMRGPGAEACECARRPGAEAGPRQHVTAAAGGARSRAWLEDKDVLPLVGGAALEPARAHRPDQVEVRLRGRAARSSARGFRAGGCPRLEASCGSRTSPDRIFEGAQGWADAWKLRSNAASAWLCAIPARQKRAASPHSCRDSHCPSARVVSRVGGWQGGGGLARLAALLSLSVVAWACRRTSLTFTRNAVAFEGLWCSTASAISLAPARREHQGD
jgi:hypothetical protein